jgi:hypothetical protein
MRPVRLTAAIGATALGAVLLATTYGAGAADAPTRPSPHVRAPSMTHDRFIAPAPHQLRPGSTLRMGLHCDSTDMSI